MEKAWKVRQRAHSENAFGGYYDNAKLLLVKPIVAVSLKEYTLVLIVHPLVIMPSDGSASYYWFNNDGTLAGAGMMNTGHRCEVASATIDDISKGVTKPTELQMNLDFNGSYRMEATFVLREEGLKLKQLVDAKGEPVLNNEEGYHIGKDLIRVQDNSQNFSAEYSFLKIEFSDITPEVDDDSGLNVGLKASICVIYPANMRLVSYNPRDGCNATFEDANKYEKTVKFRFEQLAIPDALVQKYKLGAGYRIWPKERIDWKKDSDTKQ